MYFIPYEKKRLPVKTCSSLIQFYCRVVVQQSQFSRFKAFTKIKRTLPIKKLGDTDILSIKIGQMTSGCAISDPLTFLI